MGRSKKNKTEDKRIKFKSLMKIIAGVDEVGRGSLIGPVYAAAVILNKSVNFKILKAVSYTHLTLPTKQAV